MLELLQGLTDDQKAMLGCAAALGICGAVMSASYYLGRATRAIRAPQSSRQSEPAAAHPHADGRISSIRRKAA